MSEPFRWGILGAAKFAHEFMGRAIHAAEHNVLAALATSSRDKAAPFQAFAPDITVYDDYDALLADPTIDAVYVPLPNHLHVEWTIRALKAGKHVLTEKPIAMHEAEFDDLIAARDAAGKLAAEAYMIVHHPQWIRAKEIYESGEIGALRHVTASFTYDNRTDTENIRNRPETGGGGLRDIGVYTIGSTRFVSGQEADHLTAKIEYENGVDTFALVNAQFPDFTYSGFTSIRMANRQEVVFHGEKGMMRLGGPFNANVFDVASIELELPNLARRVERFPSQNHYVLQVENFRAAAVSGSGYPCPLEFSRGTQRMIDMAFAAGDA